jgi:hypothetical protein
MLVNDLNKFGMGTLHDEMKWTDVSVHAAKLMTTFGKVLLMSRSHGAYEVRLRGTDDRSVPSHYFFACDRREFVQCSDLLLIQLARFWIQYTQRAELHVFFPGQRIACVKADARLTRHERIVTKARKERKQLHAPRASPDRTR